ncbi:pyruvate dehydrogenase, E2 component, dihydrolipoamide acetyltransferase domain protein, partial [Vibrio cholerae CP1030(3)]
MARLTPNSRARRRTTGEACEYSWFSWNSPLVA